MMPFLSIFGLMKYSHASEARDTIAQILAVTFTNQATQEMKQRILVYLHILSQGTPSPVAEALLQDKGWDRPFLRDRAQTVLSNILHQYARFSVSTIDSFFNRRRGGLCPSSASQDPHQHGHTAACPSADQAVPCRCQEKVRRAVLSPPYCGNSYLVRLHARARCNYRSLVARYGRIHASFFNADSVVFQSRSTAHRGWRDCLDSRSRSFKRIQLSVHEHIRKLLEVKDERILYVKLADRLHNMRTIEGHQEVSKQQKIAAETLQFFVPMAKSLGLTLIAKALKERAFEVLTW